MKKQFLTSLELKRNIADYPLEYPYDLDAVKNLKHIDFHENVTFIV
jgi:predicted ATPase